METFYKTSDMLLDARRINLEVILKSDLVDEEILEILSKLNNIDISKNLFKKLFCGRFYDVKVYDHRKIHTKLRQFLTRKDFSDKEKIEVARNIKKLLSSNIEFSNWETLLFEAMKK